MTQPGAISLPGTGTLLLIARPYPSTPPSLSWWPQARVAAPEGETEEEALKR
jgi:hypothetical protein